MKITDDMLDPGVRRTGALIRRVFNFKTEQDFVRTQALLDRVRPLIQTGRLRAAAHTLRTPDNARLRVCVYRARRPRPGAVGLLWLHGGGYAIGCPEQDLGFIRGFTGAANCVVVSPDYRLSPRAPYPAALNDCYQALLWMKRNAAALGIRPDQLFIGGDSAGGGLAVAVALLARDRGSVRLACQLPFYPMLDDRMRTPSSQNNDAPVWNTRANETAWRLYLGSLYGGADVPAYAAPARAASYAGLPPAYSFVGSVEPFYDEVNEYIAALRAAGVPARLDVYPGCFHGFDITCPASPAARCARTAYLSAFRRAAATCFAPQNRQQCLAIPQSFPLGRQPKKLSFRAKNPSSCSLRGDGTDSTALRASE